MSCSLTMLTCRICCRMVTSRSISSRLTPRRLAWLWRFLMNLAAYSTPVLFSRHFFTIANWPLWEQGDKKKMLLRLLHDSFPNKPVPYKAWSCKPWAALLSTIKLVLGTRERTVRTLQSKAAEHNKVTSYCVWNLAKPNNDWQKEFKPLKTVHV